MQIVFGFRYFPKNKLRDHNMILPSFDISRCNGPTMLPTSIKRRI